MIHWETYSTMRDHVTPGSARGRIIKRKSYRAVCLAKTVCRCPRILSRNHTGRDGVSKGLEMRQGVISHTHGNGISCVIFTVLFGQVRNALGKAFPPIRGLLQVRRFLDLIQSACCYKYCPRTIDHYTTCFVRFAYKI
jgi:hypothetical protein